MSDFSSYIDRDKFSQDIYDVVNEFIENNESFQDDIVLAINSKTLELKLCNLLEIDDDWESHSIIELTRDNVDDTNKKEVNIDYINDISSSFFFVR